MSEIIQSIEKFKETYYEKQPKNTFFKKSQKLDCAKEICENFNKEDILKLTMFIIPNTNIIVFDYNVFKLYANPSVYDIIVSYLLQLYDEVLKTNNTFEIHMILDTFTISAAERYKQIIQMFFDKCINCATDYSSKISKIHIYYAPSMIDTLKTMFKSCFDQTLNDKIILYSKTDSPAIIKQLFQMI
jgi:hypothetical protein